MRGFTESFGISEPCGDARRSESDGDGGGDHHHHAGGEKKSGQYAYSECGECDVTKLAYLTAFHGVTSSFQWVLYSVCENVF